MANLTVEEGTFVVYFNWTDPDDLDFDHVEILYSADGYELSTLSVPQGIQTYTSALLQHDTNYSYLLRTVDIDGNVSYGTTATVTPTYTHIEHSIDVDFDGAYSVYAEDMDGDGDMDVLGAANGADDITWWEAE